MRTKMIMLIVVCLTGTESAVFSNEFNTDYYFNIYQNYRSVPKNLMMMKHEHVVRNLEEISKRSEKLVVEKVGNSVENRSINLVSFGTGDVKILLWSQMHGNEPTATAALLAIYKYFSNNFEDPFVQNIYNELSVYSLVMLNPDGAERFQRRNAYDIDINRDAKMLQTPEGKILKKIQQRIKPDFGFNLHNMGGRETVSGTENILKIALMAPPFNKANEDNPVRIRAKKVAVYIKNILDKYIAGHIARYKADYMPRAFGDAMQFWGVSTVLLETGSYTGDDPIFLEKLNFIALLSVFDVLANNKLDKIDQKEYDKIPLEGKPVFDILIRNVLIVNGEKADPFHGDVAINIDFKLSNGKIDTVGYIKDIGDLSIFRGKKLIQANNMVLTPDFIFENDREIETEPDYNYGINSILQSNHTGRKKQKLFPDGKINIKKIPEFTSLKADKYKLHKRGRIKRNYKADLLLFSKASDSVLDLDNLKFIITNGKIKKTQTR